jgi:hypothetical protein
MGDNESMTTFQQNVEHLFQRQESLQNPVENNHQTLDFNIQLHIQPFMKSPIQVN